MLINFKIVYVEGEDFLGEKIEEPLLENFSYNKWFRTNIVFQVPDSNSSVVNWPNYKMRSFTPSEHLCRQWIFAGATRKIARN